MRRDVGIGAAREALALRLDVAGEPDGLLPAPLLNNLFEPVKCAAADKENVLSVDLDEFLVRVFSAALRRDVRDRALNDLEQCLLDTLTGDVAGNRAVFAPTRDLVDFVDIDDAALRAFHIIVCRLDQTEKNVLDVLTDIPRFRQGRRVRDGERHAEGARQRLREIGFPDAGGAEEQDVRLLQFDVVLCGLFRGRLCRIPLIETLARLFALFFLVEAEDALVVVIDGDRENALCRVLPDDVFIEHGFDFLRFRERVRRQRFRRFALRLRVRPIEQILAGVYAVIADINAGGGGDQAEYLMLRPAAEGATAHVPVLTECWHIVSVPFLTK